MSTDIDEVVLKFKNEKNEALFNDLYNCFESLIIIYALKLHKYSKSYGEDLDDCVQIMWLVFLRAVDVFYKENEDSSFKALLVCCLERERKTHLRYLCRRAKSIQTFSLDDYVDESEKISYGDIFKNDSITPDKAYELKEAWESFDSLSIKEKYIDVYVLYLYGFSYKEIAKIIKVKEKQVDNIIQLVKANLKVNL